MVLKKIISGGQTGADMGGLLAGRDLGLETGGTAPKGWKTEKGSNPELESFGLIEDDSSDYAPRTMKNVDNSDGTIAFLLKSSTGTEKTIGYCLEGKWVKRWISGNGYKPILVLDKDILQNNRDEAIKNIQNFILSNKIQILNIAGHRQSSVPKLEEAVRKILNEAIKPLIIF